MTTAYIVMRQMPGNGLAPVKSFSSEMFAKAECAALNRKHQNDSIPRLHIVIETEHNVSTPAGVIVFIAMTCAFLFMVLAAFVRLRNGEENVFDIVCLNIFGLTILWLLQISISAYRKKKRRNDE